MLTFGSLFSGIGGIDLGLERAGMECRWQVEIDGYAQKVLAKHWPDIARYGDIRECGSHNLTAVDVIAGGFPCQDISSAGKRVGISGERSGLWSEYARIIRQLRPRYVLVENVSALLNRGIDVVLGDLAESGYDAEWQSLPAAAFGAPHIRDRIFILAYSTSRHDTRGEVHAGNFLPPLVRGAAGTSLTSSPRPAHVAYADCQRLEELNPPTIADQPALYHRHVATGWGQWEVEPSVGRVADGISNRLDRLRGLGNAVVPQVAEYVGRCIVAVDQEPAA